MPGRPRGRRAWPRVGGDVPEWRVSARSRASVLIKLAGCVVSGTFSPSVGPVR
ncbi:hypothetical protein HBB16_06180 [Pseudonocardia sp. MCCB 268]|nr:hypothetical protein [Pseudonocardia cytotoxica]